MRDFSPIIQILPHPDPRGNTLAMVMTTFRFLDIVPADYEEVSVPKGFIFDGASIPRMLWRIAGHPFTAKYITAACVHDYLYSTGKVTRKTADKMFLCLLLAYDVSPLFALMMYYAVRVFGKSNYKGDK